jgi:hypothetical protein
VFLGMNQGVLMRFAILFLSGAGGYVVLASWCVRRCACWLEGDAR